MPTRTPRPYRWDSRTARYHDAQGRIVSRTQVRAAIDGALDRAEPEVRSLSEQLRAGRISLVQWELAIRQQVKDIHLWSAAAAKGGWAQMSQSDYGFVGRTVRDQYAYLRGFAAEIEAGLPLDGRFLQRTALYSKGGRAMYHRTETRDQEIRGATEYRNVRHASDSCGGCVEAEAAGWVPIGTLVPIGGRECRANCRCSLEYRSAA